MRRPGYCLLLFLMIAFSCRNKVPNGILKPEKMQAVMWDVMRAEVFTENFISRDSSKDKITENIKLQKQAFQLNGVTKEDYYKSLEFYKKQPALFGPMLDSLSARQDREREKLNKIKIQSTQDSVKQPTQDTVKQSVHAQSL